MKAYIERPMTDMPEKEGYYTVIYTESTAGSDSFYFLDDEWFDTYPEAVDEHADPIDVDGLVWLQEIEIPDPSPVVNTDVLVKALERIKTNCFNIGHAEEIAAKALSQFTTPQPDKKEEKK